ncbi:hypothetical protein M427DRAFT_44311 [Gonapodya prolifera JEL478]|uniref:Uncharacterized protein n=1 Tax=Gonapodya prolifera (strain JEL478) TaxID=1344416 RepID=A0A139AFW1_GONPJ|nr:hypothetical protein M427DRAFT_44311 [Gonapodya prolifera JEL478]|eukprot:KXS15712.1 hypothetical protein M427DRAFT_44311 [Gonapodya prolifera JEL478]
MSDAGCGATTSVHATSGGSSAARGVDICFICLSKVELRGEAPILNPGGLPFTKCLGTVSLRTPIALDKLQRGAPIHGSTQLGHNASMVGSNWAGQPTDYVPHNPVQDDNLVDTTPLTATQVAERVDLRTLLQVTLDAEHVSIPVTKEVSGEPKASAFVPCASYRNSRMHYPSQTRSSNRPTHAPPVMCQVGGHQENAVIHGGGDGRGGQVVAGGVFRNYRKIGLQLGVNINSRRLQSNPVKAIFVMTDEQNTAREDWMGAVVTAAELKLLLEIARRTSGSFNYAETEPSVPSQASVFKTLPIPFPHPPDVTIVQVTSGGQAGQAVMEQDGHAISVKYKDILYDERKVVLLEANLGPIDEAFVQLMLIIDQASFRARDTSRDSTERVTIAALTVNRTTGKIDTASRIRSSGRCNQTSRAERSGVGIQLRQGSATENQVQFGGYFTGAHEYTADSSLTPNDQDTLTVEQGYHSPLISDATMDMNRVSLYTSYHTEGWRHWATEAAMTLTAERSTNTGATETGDQFLTDTIKSYATIPNDTNAEQE